jgi:apolipoprotein N-acyltransferase
MNSKGHGKKKRGRRRCEEHWTKELPEKQQKQIVVIEEEALPLEPEDMELEAIGDLELSVLQEEEIKTQNEPTPKEESKVTYIDCDSWD